MGFAIKYHGPGSHLPARYYFLVIGIIITFHILLSAVHEPYGQATSLTQMTPAWVTKHTSWALPESTSGKSQSWRPLEGDEYPNTGHMPQMGRFILYGYMIFAKHALFGMIFRRGQRHLCHTRSQLRTQRSSPNSQRNGRQIQL